MKAIKYIMILLLILIIGGAVYFSLKDGRYDITQTRVIDAPPSVIYEQIEDFKQWDNWNPWLQNVEVETIMGAQTQGVDANYSFIDSYGSGEMTITGLEEDKSISMNMFYDNGMTSSNSEVNIALEQVEYGTLVSWNIKGEQGLLDKAMGTIFGFHMEEEITPKYKQGLKNLEDIVIKKMNISSSSVDGIIETGGGYFLYMSSSAKKENFQELKTQMLQNIMSYMQRNKIDLYGMPRVIYEKINAYDDNMIFSAAIPVQNREITATNSNILCSYQEPGKAVKVTLKGAYSNLEEARKKGQEFIDQNGLVRSEAAPYEVYKTDPMLTPNPADYLTEIYIPIQ